jgi:tetratricopeptide (TPR) repeat protein
MQTEVQDRDAIVSNAVEIASEAVRSAYISGACGNDAVLRQQVEERVAAHFQGGKEHAGANHTHSQEVPGAPKRYVQLDLANETSEAKKMGQKKPRGMMTVWALLLLPVTIGGAGLTAWKLRAEAPEQATLQQIQEELDQARKSETASSTSDAKIVLAFIQDNVLLAPGRPESWNRGGLGKDVTLRKAVDLAASKVTGAFPDRPMVEASIRETLGASYIDLGEPEQAVKQYEQAFSLRQKKLGPDHPDTCDCRNKLAVAYREAGHPDEGSRLYDLNRLNNKGGEAK